MKLVSSGVVFFVLLFVAMQAQAEEIKRYDEVTGTCRLLSDGPLAWDSLPWGEGGQQFKNNCKGCHYQGNDKGARFLWQESKGRTAWNRVFATRYPMCAQNGSWDGLSAEQLRKVNDFLYRWADNSDVPRVCL